MIRALKSRVSLTIQPFGVVRLAFHDLIVGEAVVLHVASGLRFEQRTRCKEFSTPPRVRINEVIFFYLHLGQLVHVHTMEVQRRNLVEVVGLMDLLHRHLLIVLLLLFGQASRELILRRR